MAIPGDWYQDEDGAWRYQNGDAVRQDEVERLEQAPMTFDQWAAEDARLAGVPESMRSWTDFHQQPRPDYQDPVTGKYWQPNGAKSVGYNDSVQDMLTGKNPKLAEMVAKLGPSHFKEVNGYTMVSPEAREKISKALGIGDDGFFGKDGPFQAFSKTIGLAMGLSGAINAVGGFGYPSFMSELSNVGSFPGADAGSWMYDYTGGISGTGGIPSSNVAGWFSEVPDVVSEPFYDGAAPYAGDAAYETSGLTDLSSRNADTALNGVGSGSIWSKLTSSSLGKLLSGDASGDDYIKAIGAVVPGLLGSVGSSQQANTLEGLSDKWMSLGAPFRERLNASYAPGFDLTKADPAFQGALDQSSNAVLKGLSASTGGNPFDNPGAVMEANKYVTQNTALPQLNTYRSQLGTFGQLGTSQAGTFDSAVPVATAGTYTGIGYGLGNLLNPERSEDEMLKRLGAGLLSRSQYTMNDGSKF